MNNMPTEPHSHATSTSVGKAPLKERRPWLSRRVCILAVLLAAPPLLWLEFFKPTLAEDPLLNGMVTMTLTRGIGAVVFLLLLLREGYRVLNPLHKPLGKALLFSLPPFLVVVNNMPILSLLWGDAYLEQDAPVYLICFALQCLAVGLFEELAFRGVILLMFAEKRYTTRKGLLWSLMLSSAVFGGVHLINLLVGGGLGEVILQIGYSFLIGAMCSVVLLKTHNLWLCVILHAVYNFCGTLVPTLGGGTWWDTPTVVITVLLALGTAVYLVWQFFCLDLKQVGELFPSAHEDEGGQDRP